MKKAKTPSELDLKMEEKSRLHRRYKAWRREEYKAATIADPRLKTFRRSIKKRRTAKEIVLTVFDSWVRKAPVDIRWIALRIVDDRLHHLSILSGDVGMNDPLPDQGPSAYFLVKDMIFAGGGMR